VPVHEPKKPDAILGMLLVKKLITYDPEDGLPVSSFQLTPLPESSPDLTLFDCLNYFQQGRSHMILVSKHPGEARGALGIVTLEDVIEEMIGSEIVDETDGECMRSHENPRRVSSG
jgi:metal transporter CNNM